MTEVLNTIATNFSATFMQPIETLFQPINAHVDHHVLSTFNGIVTSGQLRLMACFILGIPFGFILYSIHSPRIRKPLSLIIGLLMQLFAYQGYAIPAHIHTILVYLICRFYRSNSTRSVFILSILWLSAVHLFRQFYATDSSTIDISIIFMMNLQRYTSFAFQLSDGVSKTPLTPAQTLVAINTMPSFYEFFQYINFMGSAVAGPGFDYKIFSDFINLRGEYTVPIPSPIAATWQALLIALVEIIIVAALTPFLPIGYIATQAFGEHNLFFKLAYLTLSIMVVRIRYYAGWRLIQSAMTATGICYDGKEFNRFVMIQEDLELTYDIKDLIVKWNCSTQVWMKNYVYFRLFTLEEYKKSRDKMALGQQATLMMSALWHGFYPGYYIAFFFWGVQLSITNQLTKFEQTTEAGRILVTKLGIVWKVFNWIWMKTIMNCFGAVFVLLSFSKSWQFLHNLDYLPIFFLIAMYITVTIVTKVFRNKVK